MSYTKEKTMSRLAPTRQDLIDCLAGAWEREVAELRELCRLLNQHADKFDFEGTSSKDEKRVHELWAKHITKDFSDDQ